AAAGGSRSAAGRPGGRARAGTSRAAPPTAPLSRARPAADPATGTLTSTPAAGAVGSAAVTVRLSDNGGTANGGVDTSAPQTFTITVRDVPPAPTPPANQAAAQGAAGPVDPGSFTHPPPDSPRAL